MNPLDQLIDAYMAEGMTEREAINQIKEDASKGRNQRNNNKSEKQTNKAVQRIKLDSENPIEAKYEALGKSIIKNKEGLAKLEKEKPAKKLRKKKKGETIDD